MLADLHNHTYSSFDGMQTVSQMCADALKNNISIVACTEHYDCDIRGGMMHFSRRIDSWLEETAAAQKEYGGAVRLLRGIEVGQMHIYPKTAREFISSAPFDVVIGSIHDIRGGRDIYAMRPDSVDEFFEEYFSEMCFMIEQGGFDILGHLDYPIRVFEKQLGGIPSLKRWESLITPCLQALVTQGISLELNTALLRSWAGGFGMEPWLLQKYKSLGGEMVSTGSDGHGKEKMTGLGIARAYEYLKENGFDRVTVFCGRKPEFIHII